jgi:hypothetical protein
VLQRRREAGKAFLLAATAENATARLAAAHGEAPAGARGEFVGGLEALGGWLRDLMAVAAGAGDTVPSAADARWLEGLARKRGIAPEGVARALLRVQEAREQAAGNVNPQLIVAALLRGMRADLLRAP